MRKIKEVLRLRFELGLGQRQIARSCGMGLGTVHEYLERAANFPEPDSGQLPELASGVGRCSTADESHAELHEPITAGLPVTRAHP